MSIQEKLLGIAMLSPNNLLDIFKGEYTVAFSCVVFVEWKSDRYM